MKPDISVLIVTYRSEKHIKPLLDSLKKGKGKLNIETTVVDNYGKDNSLKIAAEHPLKPATFQSKTNQGFAKGVNQALEHAHGKYIFLINPDCRLVGGCLNTLFNFAEKNTSYGAVVPRLVFPDGKIQPSVMNLPSIWNAFKEYFLGVNYGFNKYVPKKIDTVEVAVMAAMLIPQEVIKKIGNLDEKFFLYYEDIEFCQRLKKFKLPIYYLPQAKVKHVHGASGNFKSHLNSPLAQSAKIYHGVLYSHLLNLTLYLGQKWQKLLSKIKKR